MHQHQQPAVASVHELGRRAVADGDHAAGGFCPADGEMHCPAMTTARWASSFQSRMTVCHHGCVVVLINDREAVVGRHLDLTPTAARAIGLTGNAQLDR
jgi:glycine/D-amino acid oxidase-like deaminating enzyme